MKILENYRYCFLCALCFATAVNAQEKLPHTDCYGDWGRHAIKTAYGMVYGYGDELYVGREVPFIIDWNTAGYRRELTIPKDAVMFKHVWTASDRDIRMSASYLLLIYANCFLQEEPRRVVWFDLLLGEEKIAQFEIFREPKNLRQKFRDCQYEECL